MSVNIPFGDIPEKWSHLMTDGPWININYHDHFTEDEYKHIHKGIVPTSMEDQWIIFSGEEWIWACRSWGGYVVYAYKFESDGDGVSLKKVYARLNSFSDYARETPSVIINGARAVLRQFLHSVPATDPLALGDREVFPY